jgi:glycine cleavage system H lipoate-binding protein
MKKKEKAIEEHEKKPKSPIFMSPEKALSPLTHPEQRFFHFSHSWVLPDDKDGYYTGFDNFISFLFSDQVTVDSLPARGTQIQQGEKIWDVKANNKKITQLSPISGEITEINPAFSISVPLASDEIETSWILKIKPSSFKTEVNNLMDSGQGHIMNTAVKDVISRDFHSAEYLNDGGRIDPSFIMNMKNEEWEAFIKKFFPAKTE